MVITIGDIVELRAFPGRWAVIGPVPNPADPARQQWKLRRDDGNGHHPQGHTAGSGDITVLEHPEFTPGQMVNYFGNEARVLSDDGGTIRLRYRYARGRGLDRYDGLMWMPSVAIGEADVGRGELVAQNL